MNSPLATARLIALLPLCALGLLPGAAHAHADPCAGLPNWSLLVALDPGERPLSSAALIDRFDGREAAADQVLERLQIDLPRADLVALLERIDEDPTLTDIPDPLRPSLEGVSGLSTMLLLTDLLLGKPQKMTGKIRDYVYLDGSKSGHLAVEVCINNARFYHWDVVVGEGEFTAHPRSEDEQDYPDNPFPDVDLALPAMAVDPDNPLSIWARNLTHKLHARGPGIRVENVYYRDLADPDLVRLDDSHPFYTSTEESCVDLFTPGYPPATVGELIGNDYCLGRCGHPAIINTGG